MTSRWRVSVSAQVLVTIPAAYRHADVDFTVDVKVSVGDGQVGRSHPGVAGVAGVCGMQRVRTAQIRRQDAVARIALDCEPSTLVQSGVAGLNVPGRVAP